MSTTATFSSPLTEAAPEVFVDSVWQLSERVPTVTGIQHVESADGTPIAYRASGSGAPMLLVHGSATTSADWLFVLPLLRDRFTVVTMDRRGRGASGDGPDHAIAREAEDVLAVLDAVAAEVLVGHSFGALCSILAAEQTDRLRLSLRADGWRPPRDVKQLLAHESRTLRRQNRDPLND